MRSYDNWPQDPDARWIEAGNTFGHHLITAARDYARARVGETVTESQRAVAHRAIDDAIYGVMMLLDGVSRTEIDSAHRVEYALIARMREGSRVVEEIELAPGGDGLCLGFHGWRNGDFG